MKVITIAIVPELTTAAWWTAAGRAKEIPRELRPLMEGRSSTVDVPHDRARDLRAWCKSLPGWDAGGEPLLFDGMAGRPRSARRSGGKPVTVRLSADEYAALDALGAARGQSIAEVLRTCALAEARREGLLLAERIDAEAPADRGRRGAGRSR